MGRFLSFGIVLIVAIGLALHFDVEIPGFSDWIGHLPGDLILYKKGVAIYLPFTTSAVFSAALCLLGSLFSSKK